MKITRRELKALIKEQMTILEVSSMTLTDHLNAAFTAAKAGNWTGQSGPDSADKHWRDATEHDDAGGVAGLFSYGLQEEDLVEFKADLDNLGAHANPEAKVTVDVA